LQPQASYEYDLEPQNPLDLILKDGPPDQVMEEVPRQQILPISHEEPIESPIVREHQSAGVDELVLEPIPTSETQSLLNPEPAPLIVKTEPPKKPPTPPAKEKRSSLLKTKRPLPAREKKTKTVKYEESSSSDEPMRGDKDRKQKRLERNRKSARESRRRKKEYIKRLELQVFLIIEY